MAEAQFTDADLAKNFRELLGISKKAPTESQEESSSDGGVAILPEAPEGLGEKENDEPAGLEFTKSDDIEDVDDSDSEDEKEQVDIQAGEPVPFHDPFTNGMAYTAAEPASAHQQARLKPVEAHTLVDLWEGSPKPFLKYEPEHWNMMVAKREQYLKRVEAYVSKKKDRTPKHFVVDRTTGVPTGGVTLTVGGENVILKDRVMATQIACGYFGVQGYIPWKLLLKQDRKEKIPPL